MNAPLSRRSLTVTAKHSFEVEVSLSGTFCPGYADTYMEPGCADSMEDIDVEDFGALAYVPPAAPGLRPKWRPVDLVKGVDRNSEAYKQIVSNILEFIGDEAANALLGELV